MNGNTKHKLQGGLIGGVVGVIATLLIIFGHFTYSYGQLNNRVDEIEKKADKIVMIDQRLAVIEAAVKRIDSKL